MWRPHRALAIGLLFSLLATVASAGESSEKHAPAVIGVVASLSSFAANYGSAVVEGAKLAAAELEKEGQPVKLVIEDDQSDSKNAVAAYQKLVAADRVKGIIGGSWWINSIVKPAERQKIPLLSCETLYDKDTIRGDNYFIIHGDLRDWVRVYEPIVAARGLKRGAVIRFASGFGMTIESEMREIFSRQGRTFVGAVEYSDIQAGDSAAVVLELKKLKPEVVYIDAQPSGLAHILSKIAATGLRDLTIFTNSIADDVMRDKLFDLAVFPNLYFTRRVTFEPKFAARFKAVYGKEPYLNADLGYNAVKLMTQALHTSDPIAAIRGGLEVDGRKFSFNSNNVYSGTPQTVWRVVDGVPVATE